MSGVPICCPFFALSTLYFLEGSHYNYQHLRKKSYYPHPYRWSISINYLECFCLEDVSLLLIHWFIHSFLCQYRLVNIYFILWIILQCDFILVLRLFQLWPLGVLSVWFLWSYQCVCVCVYLALLPLPCFLAPQNADLVFTFPAPILESAISPKNHGSFYWRILLETKIWIVDMLLIAIRVCWKTRMFFCFLGSGSMYSAICDLSTQVSCPDSKTVYWRLLYISDTVLRTFLYILAF